MKKSFLRNTAASNQTNICSDVVGRDQQALIVPIKKIKLEANIRHEDSSVDDLAESIKAHGLLQPLIVRHDQGQFVLVAGHRRYQALLNLGVAEAPVRVQNVSEEQSHILKLIENIQRKNLSAWEEITAVANLLSSFEGNQTFLATAVGKSKTYVSRCLKAFEVIPRLSCDVATYNKSVLFELADSDEPEKLLLQLKNGHTVEKVRKERKPSGPLPGGRSVDKVINYREYCSGRRFTLRIHFDFDQTAEGDKERLIKTLRFVLQKLERSK